MAFQLQYVENNVENRTIFYNWAITDRMETLIYLLGLVKNKI